MYDRKRNTTLDRFQPMRLNMIRRQLQTLFLAASSMVPFLTNSPESANWPVTCSNTCSSWACSDKASLKRQNVVNDGIYWSKWMPINCWKLSRSISWSSNSESQRLNWFYRKMASIIHNKYFRDWSCQWHKPSRQVAANQLNGLFQKAF